MYTPELAAMLIFLNRTGFNGLFRLNRQGGFNVPAGRYTDPRICDETHLRAVAAALASPGVTIDLQPFDRTLAEAGEGDFVYCDPPYAPLSRTSSFANYTADGFTSFDQRRLQQAVVAACARGAHVVVSNSSAAEIVQRLHDARSAEGETGDQARAGASRDQLARVGARARGRADHHQRQAGRSAAMSGPACSRPGRRASNARPNATPNSRLEPSQLTQLPTRRANSQLQTLAADSIVGWALHQVRLGVGIVQSRPIRCPC